MIAIYSSNYSPAHAQHIESFARGFRVLDVPVTLLLDDRYLQNHPRLATVPSSTPRTIRMVLIANMGLKNIWLSVLWRLQRRSVVFCVHEPISDIWEFIRLSERPSRIASLILKSVLIRLQIRLSSALVVFSNRSAEQVPKSMTVHRMNLPFLDQAATAAPRAKLFISYIGTATKDHAFDEFVDFAIYCASNNLFPEHTFLIATSTAVDPSRFVALTKAQSERIELCTGSIMSDAQIDGWYSASAVVWCAYKRSNQSGVLPKAYMFGSPIIGSPNTSGEFFADGQHGKTILTYDAETIGAALENILKNWMTYAENCRCTYLETFDVYAQLGMLGKMVETES